MVLFVSYWVIICKVSIRNDVIWEWGDDFLYEGYFIFGLFYLKYVEYMKILILLLENRDLWFEIM